MPTTMPFDLIRAQQELDGHSWVLDKMINSPSVPLTIIERQFTRIAWIVEAIPPEHQSLARLWTDKLATFLEQFAAIAMKRAFKHNASSEAIDTSINLNSTLNISPFELSASLDQSLGQSLEEQLNYLETSIRLLLETPASSTVILVSKMNELLSLVCQIPATDEPMRQLWKEKVAKLQHRHLAPMATTTNAPVEHQSTSVSSKTSSECFSLSSLENSLQSTASAITLLLSFASPPLLQLKLSNLKQLIDTIPRENTDLLEYWNDKFIDLMAKCGSISTIQSQSVQKLRQCTIEQKMLFCSDLTQENLGQLSNSSGFEDAELVDSTFANDYTLQLEDELESLEAQVYSLMSSDAHQVGLLDERFIELVSLVDDLWPDLPITDKWVNKIGELMTIYINLPEPQQLDESGNLSHSSASTALVNTAMFSLKARIEYLFSCHPHPIDQLKENIDQLRSHVMQMSLTDPMLNEWKGEVALFTLKLGAISTGEESGIDGTSRRNCIRRSTSTEVIRQWLNDASFSKVTSSSKDYIRIKLARAFTNLTPIPDESDLYKHQIAIRKLLDLTAKSRKILAALDTDNKALSTDVLNWAFSKFSSQLMAAHNKRFSRPNLSTLVFFLCRRLAEESAPPTDISYDTIFCHYCKATGHMKVNCPKVLLVTCFNCFEVGHNKKLCSKEEAHPDVLLASL